jgi:hypothetical protein
MTAVLPALHTIAFGDLDTGSWGAAWGGSEPLLTVGDRSGSRTLSATVDGSRADGEWRLSADGVSLLLAPVGEPAPTGGEDDGFDQLCRVTGRFELDGSAREVDSLGRRGTRPREVDLKRCDSVRDVSAWFGPDDGVADEGIAVVAMRANGAHGHEADVVTAALVEANGPVAVADPRLSTTYDAAGLPISASLELWLDEEGEQYPRRAAGEAVGTPACLAHDGLDVVARLFRWHSRGREGAGVYLLVRFR